MKSFTMKLIILALFVASAYGCGRPTYPPIITGALDAEDAREHSWPWQVSVQYEAQLGGDIFVHACGGTLISNQWVLTAARCIREGSFYRYRLHLGKHNLYDSEAGSIVLSHEKIIVNEAWDRSRVRNDIALIKLPAPVQFSDTIMAACLPTFDELLSSDLPCYVSGWGYMWNIGTNGSLRQGLIPVVDNAICSQPDWVSGMLNHNMICAGGDGHTSTCPGDPGGAMTCQKPDGSWTVYGVMSRGTNDCYTPKRPVAFTRVTSYIFWINHVITTH